MPTHDLHCQIVVTRIDPIRPTAMVDLIPIEIRSLGIVLIPTERMATVVTPIGLGQDQVTVIRPIVIVPVVVPMQGTIKGLTAQIEISPTAIRTNEMSDLISIGKIEPTAILTSEINWKTFVAEDRSMTARFAIDQQMSKTVSVTATEVIVMEIETEIEMVAAVTGIEIGTGMAAGMMATDATCLTIGIVMRPTRDTTITADSATVGTIAGTPTTGTSAVGTSTPIVHDQATGGRGVRRID